jgi:predicted Ser/Thr protein kinase
MSPLADPSPAMKCPSCLADNPAEAARCFACGAPLDPSLASLAEGALFASRFEIRGPLGRGGMGMVYRAYDRELGETVAIKVLRPDIARESGRVAQRFRSEIRLARRVRHPNVCSVYGDGEDHGLAYICMELVEGENLARSARERSGLPWDEAWDVALQVVSGLEAIHEAGIVHRDLKTANLMRDRRGAVRVMDFGIAKRQEDTETRATGAGASTLMGTPEYMSPEQLRGERVDCRSDLYSLAAVIYELFTGSPPLRGDSPVATIVKQLQEAPRLDSPKLPDPLRPVLRRALSKNPADRHASASELCRALAEARSSRVPGSSRELEAPAAAALDDETRPVAKGALPERVPVARLVLAQLMLAGVAAHLILAGGVARPQPRPGSPVVRAAAVPVKRPSGFVGPAVPGQAAASSSGSRRPLGRADQASGRGRPGAVDRTRVYRLSEVDVKPRRVAGTSAPYPEWGPRLPKGKRVSITASYVVTEHGDVTDIRVEEGGGVLEAVLLEMSRWKYRPGMKNGVPVKVRIRWRYTYIG